MYRLFLLLSVALATIVCLWLGLPWWSPAIASVLLAAALPVWRRGGFWFACLAGMLVWGIYAGWLHWENAGRLGDRLAVTFGVPNGWALVAATTMMGGLTTGLGGWFGASLRRIFVRTADNSFPAPPADNQPAN